MVYPKHSQRPLQSRRLFLHVRAQGVTARISSGCVQVGTILTCVSVNLSLCIHLSLLYVSQLFLVLVREFVLSYSLEAYFFFEHLVQCLLNTALSSLKHIFPLNSCSFVEFSHFQHLISLNPDFDLDYIPTGKT